MALKNLASWNSNVQVNATSACGTACGSGDKLTDKPSACGSACGAGDK